MPGAWITKTGQQSQVSQVECDQKTWKISLDVSHFGSEEVSVKTKEGYLEITGKHEERRDEQGVISRSFTRKYKLPAEADLHQMSCTLSPEGILVVEAPLASSPIPFPAETEIPIQMLENMCFCLAGIKICSQTDLLLIRLNPLCFNA
uniref:Heat shock protein family B (small) member 1 n=1 Tax=Astyanax mexicanus TaxID=7994 RepID=A0A8B9KJZ9_ASTMX